jgi:O-antigen/teichoic acid export membrane protein
MRRFFVKNILFVITINVLVKPIWVFFIDRVVQNRVGAEAYGTYSPLLSLSIIFSIILDFGITNYNSRTISQNPDQLKHLFSSMLTARLLLILVYMGVVCSVAFISGNGVHEMLLLCGVLLIQSLNSLLLFIRSNVAALQRFKTDGMLSVADRFLMILVCGFLLLYPGTGKNFRIEWFIIAQIACYLTACVIAYYVLRHIHEIKLRLSFHAPTIFRIIKDSFQYALFIFLMGVYIRSDMQMIKWISGAEQAGVYAASYRLLDVSINMFGSMFAAVLLPLFGRMLSQKQDVNQIVKLCVNIMLPISFIVSVAAVFFGTPIMQTLYPAATANWGAIFGWVMAAFPGFSIMYVYSTLLTANGNLKLLSALAFAGAVINILLNIYLINHQQALGAAITCAITETLMGVGYIYFCVRKLKVSMEAKWVFSHILFLVLIVGVAYATTLIHIKWVYEAAIFTVACGILIFVFGFISVQGVKQLLTKKITGADQPT